MRKVLYLALSIIVVVVVISRFNPFSTSDSPNTKSETSVAEAAPPKCSTIIETVKPGEALYDIFTRLGLDTDELYEIAAASRSEYNVGRLTPGRSLSLEVDDENHVRSLTYNIDSNNMLRVKRTDKGFSAEKCDIPYTTTLVHLSGTVHDNLVSSMDDLLLALDLSDIFAWDTDFATDIRKGDTYKLVVEEQRLDGQFVKYGKILAAEFINNGRAHYAYRYDQNGKVDYFDREGRSLKKAFLKAPLSFRRISSTFSRHRFHPVLKVYRPHLGVDYAAPRGTPVSSVGDGTVIAAGYRKGNGNYVKIKHPNGYITYYLHLDKIRRGIHRGTHVKQGQVIGNVGSTGYATGPHLDYRVMINGNFVNPLTLKLPPGVPVSKAHLASFRAFRDGMNSSLATIELPVTASNSKAKDRG